MSLASRARLSRGAITIIVAVLVMAAGIFFYKLSSQPFQDYDEATYAEVTAESFASHDFLTFHFLGVDYFRKPPLLFWLMSADNLIIHNVELADRLPSALSGLLAVAAVMLIVYAATGNGYAAAFGGGLLLAIVAFVEPARQVRFDTMVSFFDILAVLAFFKSLSNRKWFLWYGVFIGLAIMSKGPLVLYAFVPSLVLAFVLGKWRWLKDPYFWSGVGIAVLIVFPWHIYETLTFGGSFWAQYVGYQVIQRVATPLFTVPTTNATYFTYLFTLAAPVTELLCVSFLLALFLWKRFTQNERALYLASLGAIATVLVVCLVTQTKATTYLIPLYPFEAVAVAVASWVVWRQGNLRLKYVCIVVGIFLVASGMYTSARYALLASAKNDSDIELATEEKSIGEYLRTAHAPTFYVYDTTTLGSIMYYSGIVQPPWISDTQIPPLGAYLLYPTEEAKKLAQEYPNFHLTPVIHDNALSLGEVTP